MDLKMRDGDGLEATQAIRQECPETQVLILTSYGSPELLRRASAAGAAGYFLKDVDPDNLVTAIQAVRHGQTMISAEMAQCVLNNDDASADPRRRRKTGAARLDRTRVAYPRRARRRVERQGDGDEVVLVGVHGQEPSPGDLPEARRPQPRSGPGRGHHQRSSCHQRSAVGHDRRPRSVRVSRGPPRQQCSSSSLGIRSRSRSGARHPGE